MNSERYFVGGKYFFLSERPLLWFENHLKFSALDLGGKNFNQSKSLETNRHPKDVYEF